ncbi:FUSC family protein [Streptomyces albus]|uniref:FUSC family protein n=1 Tax=Streptomyces albus TaxID=1888 RepID=UPI0006E25569|nr:aromatic acid exporter family protein [Streptomyces albus]
MRQWLTRAKGSAGYERHTLELIGKSALAATVAWFVAHDLMAARSPAFAPFSAVLMMQVTVYRSLLQSLRYLGAVVAGVAIQAALGFLAGPDLLTFALVALIAMVIGRWRRLGTQGGQVATAAFFAFSTYTAATGNAQRVEQLGQIVALVGVGCAIGVVVNVLILPPMRYRGAEEGIRILAHSLCDLLGDIWPALRDGDLDEERTRHWRQRTTAFGSLNSQARAAFDTAVESKFYNPRRLLAGHRDRGFSGYGEVLSALQRVTWQVTSLTRTLEQWPEEENGPECRAFLRDYARLLAALASVFQQFAELREEELPSRAEELRQAAGTAQEERSRLLERAHDTSLPLADPSRPYGVLLVEAGRLTDEAQHSCDVLRRSFERGAA